MPLINLTVQHGRTLEEAGRRLEMAVEEITTKFGTLVRRVDWTADRKRVKLDGVGFWVEMWVDAQAVHATGDIPILSGLLGGQLGSGLKQILQQTFQKKLQP
jgi:putative polyhydroxyalkanoic acid system protein